MGARSMGMEPDGDESGRVPTRNLGAPSPINVAGRGGASRIIKSPRNAVGRGAGSRFGGGGRK